MIPGNITSATQKSSVSSSQPKHSSHTMTGIPVELLAYVVGSYDESTGEWAMHCPHPDHQDTRRSASVNVPNQVWYCHGCSQGGPVDALVATLAGGEWGSAEVRSKRERRSKGEALSQKQVRRWHKFLLSKEFRTERSYLTKDRGLSRETIKEFQIGYDPLREVYTIPVYWEGKLQNVRRYDPDPGPEFPKIRNVKGHGQPVLYPHSILEEAHEHGQIVVCEGEWDALVAIQNGVLAITRTGGADTWHSTWNEQFEGLDVIACHDMDEKGAKANLIIETELAGIANRVTTVSLPSDEKGYDLSDYFVRDGHTAEDFAELLSGPEQEPADVLSVLESLDGGNFGKASPMRIRVGGVAQDQFLYPHRVALKCGQDQDDRCLTCPMNALGGKTNIALSQNDPGLLHVLYGGNRSERKSIVDASPLKGEDCPSFRYQIDDMHSVTKVFATQFFDEDASDLTNNDVTTMRQFHIVGLHDITANKGVKLIGEQRVNPQNNKNEVVGWASSAIETDLDTWSMTDDEVAALHDLVSAPVGKVGKKLRSIADDLAEHVTHIYGRSNMHIFMDLVWHSVMRFNLGDEEVTKGWLDAVVVGETRTGKSEAASRLRQMYRRGEMVSLESSSLAGVLGGVQQMSGKEWVTTWGVIPMNDRGLVVLDEVSGFNSEEIGHLSAMRSSGIAELTKIRSDRTLARTRLLWIGNPRSSDLHYSSGVRMLQDLVEKPEDLARFDMAMSVHSNDPGTERANQITDSRPERQYAPELLQKVVGWAWSRTPEDVVIGRDTLEAIYEKAIALGEDYASRPPLIQQANVRVKLARVAAAIAARTFSTDDGVRLIVRPDHVSLAAKFLRSIYDRQQFGYGHVSKLENSRVKRAHENWDNAKTMLINNRELTVYLRGVDGFFSALELRNMAAYAEFSQAVQEASNLYQMGFLDKHGEQYAMTPQIIELIREIPA